ncbi:group 1 glycosyl transferase [Acinetobacter baumannii]|uniref:glycosyltransferase family 4 protein n=1 Tax=Acinetobacter baumannii TaxID=470 RepID=UPI000A3BBD71|nr:glycosyltransferase family 4 protein [Acinetobacter baumannii]AYX86019.1 glycosyltransferase family 4 protein [Acinetobacter baumannii]MCJ9202298.1 glycosyltransferase family 4 protein [Acinetobacter baumannii]MCJ9352247.1 glycosyltransferase family 4 protein [Acinetobacter baumannii]MCR0011004.1 glycosyltransferase family 4 protein [Acinetobacter baumannii]MDA4982137.1 glycosyltransferase family 4 protein [Acinetobacter baumannii]
MKNICFLIGDISHSGGTERVTTLIANQLVLNHCVHVLSLSNGATPFFAQYPTIINNRLFDEKVSMRKHYVAVIKKLRNYLLYHKIDTLVVVDSISCVFTVPACTGLRINHICWEHFNLKVNLGSWFRDLGRWMAAKWCNKIVTLTERDKSFWDKRFDLEHTNKVVAIANPSPYELQENTPSLEHKTILCVGRLTYQKGFDLLIPSWSKVAHKLDGWKIIIVGTGEDEANLKEMAVNYGVSDSIIFAGQQKNMDPFYRQASFFCMSSRFEGLPMVLLEAQSFGLPLVAFNCNTGPSDIIENGVNGYLVESLNVSELANKLLDMSKKPLDEYVEMVNLSKLNSRKFYLENILNQWLNII